MERVLLLFLQKLFHLPLFAPDYLLFLETSLDLVLAFSLNRQLLYISKVAEMPNRRLPRIFWAGSWGEAANTIRWIIEIIIDEDERLPIGSTYTVK